MDFGDPALFHEISKKTPQVRILACVNPDDNTKLELLENVSPGNERSESASENSDLFGMCRICADRNQQVVPIFEGRGAKQNLCEKIHNYLPIKISKDDTLPLQLCHHCATTILAWHDMFEGCLHAEKTLLRIEAELRVKKNIVKHPEIAEREKEFGGAATESEELVDDPEPIGQPEKESIRSGEKTDGPCEAVASAPSPETEKRSVKSKKPFELYLGARNIIETSRNVTNEVINVERSTRSNSEEMWRDVLYKSVEDHSTSLELPIVANEDLKCRVDETSKAAAFEVTPSFKAEDIEEEAFLLSQDEDTARRSDNQEDRDSRPSDDSGPDDGDGKARCNICSLEFSHPNELRAHAKDHENSPIARKIYQCVECVKSFRQKDSFVRHLRIHRDERPFTCHVCGKQFRDSGGLSRHLKDVHAKLKNFSCDLCGKCFSAKTTRDDHRRTHTGERPYVCEKCDKSFKSKACLYSHSRLHTDEFPHPCPYCNKKFRRRQAMLVHATTHTGEKNYSCDVCYKRFRVKTEVVRHKLTHSDEKPFVCAKCGLRFRQNRYLNNHIKTRHAAQSSKD